MRAIIMLLILSTGLSSFALTRDDKEDIRNFFVGESRLEDGIELAKGADFAEPPSQYASDLFQAIQETCLMDIEEGQFFSRYELSGEFCVTPGLATSRSSAGNGVASGEDTLNISVHDNMFSETTGRTGLKSRLRWNAQQNASGQFRGQSLMNAQHDLADNSKGFVDSRVDYSGFQDVHGDYHINNWQQTAQMKFGRKTFNIRANLNPQSEFCSINNSSISCSELFELVGGKETVKSQLNTLSLSK